MARRSANRTIGSILLWSVGLVAGLAIIAVTAAGVPVPGGTSTTVPAPGPGDRSAIVRVRTTTCASVAVGSGVIVDGVVVTNRHVLAGARDVTVMLADGTVVPANALRISDDLDVGTIEVSERDRAELGTGAELSSEPGPLASGTEVLIGGHARGGAVRVRPATVVRYEDGATTSDPPHPMLLDLPVEPGESGSPVFGESDQVVGLVYARSRSDGAALALGAPDLVSALRAAQPAEFRACR